MDKGNGMKKIKFWKKEDYVRVLSWMLYKVVWWLLRLVYGLGRGLEKVLILAWKISCTGKFN